MSEHLSECEWPQPMAWVQTCPNDLKVAKGCIESILNALRNYISDKMAFAIELALEEALVNAIRHGNVLLIDGVKVKDEDGKDKADPDREFRIAFSVDAMSIRVEIGNECVVSFDPRELPDPTDDEHLEIPNGRGIVLDRTFASRTRWNGNLHNNRIALVWDRDWEGMKDEVSPDEPYFENGLWLLDSLSEQEVRGLSPDITRASEDARASLSSSLSTSRGGESAPESQ